MNLRAVINLYKPYEYGRTATRSAKKRNSLLRVCDPLKKLLQEAKQRSSRVPLVMRLLQEAKRGAYAAKAFVEQEANPLERSPLLT